MLGLIASAASAVKTCSKCGLVKPHCDFTRSRQTKDGYHGWCRPCLYLALKRAYKERRTLVEDVKKRPCTDCGQSFPTWVLEFDHLRDKTFKIGTVQKGRDKLQAEIAKCEVVCSNCHRFRSQQRATALSNGSTVQRKAWREWLSTMKAQPCLDCRGVFHTASMDFDHVRGTKLATVSQMMGCRLQAVLEEIQKCDLVCANCHAHRTYCRSHGIEPYTLTQVA